MLDSEKRYRAYKLLRELDSLTSSTMNQVAYGHFGGSEWVEACVAHRAAFHEWIMFAESLSDEVAPIGPQDSEPEKPI
ncbi:hypothetical protein [Pseudomonas farsensis]|uniref:Uncharacterized protein n=1 Tax=Pseudomonas farsensis TaxID=2745492 RepID=A0ABU8QSD8_9PSED